MNGTTMFTAALDLAWAGARSSAARRTPLSEAAAPPPGRVREDGEQAPENTAGLARRH